MRALLPLCFMLILCTYANSNIVRKRFAPFNPEVEEACDPQGGNQTFVEDVDDCSSYYICDHGWPKRQKCPENTIWTQNGPDEGRCEDYAVAVNEVCGYIPPLETTTLFTTEKPPEYTGVCEYECGDTCIAYEMICDGVVNCPDSSDEPATCADPCTEDNCRAPNCRCASPTIPGGFNPGEIPQLIMMTWENALRLEDYNHLYTQIFMKMRGNRVQDIRRNPNGCPIVGTFFVQHQFTDYVGVQHMYFSGNEIAAFSVSHRTPAEYWKTASIDQWAEEFGPQHTMFSTFASVNDVKGVKAPFLEMGGDNMFSMMESNGYEWDMSWSTPQMEEEPIFPFTLDHRANIGCTIEPCPVQSHPGKWEFPLVNWIDTNDTLCSGVDACYMPNDKEEALELLRSNFNRHYRSNRSPLPLVLRPRWFYENHYNLEALQEWLQEVEEMPDVYFVTVSDALRWIKNPVSNIDAADFFGCDYSDRIPACLGSLLCEYMNITYPPNSEEHPGDRFLHTCADACPDVYPWTDNPTGKL